MRHLTYANVVATLALVVAVGTGGAWAASTLITGRQVKDASLTGRDIKRGSLGADRLRRGDFDKLRGAVGPAGPVGAAGAAGTNGVNGRDGAAGKDAISDMKIVLKTSAKDSASPKFVTVACPAGYLATGGAGSATLGISQLAVETFFVGSPGLSSTGYTALASEVVATPEEWDVSASANCAKLSG